MSKVTELGYLGIGVTDLAAWRDFCERILGFQVLDEREGDRFYLRLDLWHHRIVVHQAADDDVAYVGWRVGGSATRTHSRLCTKSSLPLGSMSSSLRRSRHGSDA